MLFIHVFDLEINQIQSRLHLGLGVGCKSSTCSILESPYEDKPW